MLDCDLTKMIPQFSRNKVLISKTANCLCFFRQFFQTLSSVGWRHKNLRDYWAYYHGILITYWYYVEVRNKLPKVIWSADYGHKSEKSPIFLSETSKYRKFNKLSGSSMLTYKIDPQNFRSIYQKLDILHRGFSDAGL